MASQLEYTREGRVARITLNRPHVRNALSRRLLEELDAAFDEAVADSSVGAIAVFGDGDHFCSGHDLGSPEELEDRAQRPFPADTEGRVAWMRSLTFDNHRRWRDLPKPTLTGVQGYCIYGGLGLISVLDVIVASDDALFLPSVVQFFTLPWDVTSRRVKELLYENRFIDAQEALDLGLVNRVVTRADLVSSTMDQAARIADMDPLELRLAKRAANAAAEAMGLLAGAEQAFSLYMLLLEHEVAAAEDPNAGRRRPRVTAALDELRDRQSRVAN